MQMRTRFALLVLASGIALLVGGLPPLSAVAGPPPGLPPLTTGPSFTPPGPPPIKTIRPPKPTHPPKPTRPPKPTQPPKPTRPPKPTSPPPTTTSPPPTTTSPPPTTSPPAPTASALAPLQPGLRPQPALPARAPASSAGLANTGSPIGAMAGLGGLLVLTGTLMLALPALRRRRLGAKG